MIRPVDVSPFKEVTTGGYYHIAAILENQTAVTWGWGVYGQLGRGSTADSNVPVKVPGVANVVSIDTGYYHTIAATASGQVYAWGNNSNRQVSQESSPVYVLSPRIVGGALTGKKVVKVAANALASFALTDTGELYTFGSSSNNGNGLAANAPIPTLLMTGVREVWAAEYRGHVIKTDGTIMGWGSGAYGAIGNSGTANTTPVVAFPTISAANVRKIAHGLNHTSVLTRDGKVLSVGQEGNGAIGDGGTGSGSALQPRAAMISGAAIDVSAVWYGGHAIVSSP